MSVCLYVCIDGGHDEIVRLDCAILKSHSVAVALVLALAGN